MLVEILTKLGSIRLKLSFSSLLVSIMLQWIMQPARNDKISLLFVIQVTFALYTYYDGLYQSSSDSQLAISDIYIVKAI
jgi:hypothetical protein